MSMKVNHHNKARKAMVIVAIVSALGFSAAASAGIDVSQTFTWSGSVPVAPTNKGFIIKTETGADINPGTLNFSLNATGEAKLTSSSNTSFKVWELPGLPTDPVTVPAKSYKLELTGLSATNGAGFPQEQPVTGGYYTMVLDQQDFEKQNEVSITDASKPSFKHVLSVKESVTGPAAPNAPKAGNAIDLQAVIAVMDASV